MKNQRRGDRQKGSANDRITRLETEDRTLVPTFPQTIRDSRLWSARSADCISLRRVCARGGQPRRENGPSACLSHTCLRRSSRRRPPTAPRRSSKRSRSTTSKNRGRTKKPTSRGRNRRPSKTAAAARRKSSKRCGRHPPHLASLRFRRRRRALSSAKWRAANATSAAIRSSIRDRISSSRACRRACSACAAHGKRIAVATATTEWPATPFSTGTGTRRVGTARIIRAANTAVTIATRSPTAQPTSGRPRKPACSAARSASRDQSRHRRRDRRDRHRHRGRRGAIPATAVAIATALCVAVQCPPRHHRRHRHRRHCRVLSCRHPRRRQGRCAFSLLTATRDR